MKKVVVLFLAILVLSFNLPAIYLQGVPSPHILMQQASSAYLYSFGFTFLFGFIGGYLLWGIFGSLSSVLSVYILTKDKKMRRWAWYGCIIGCALGITIKLTRLNS